MIYKATNNLEKLFPKTKHSVIIYFVATPNPYFFPTCMENTQIIYFLILFKKNRKVRNDIRVSKWCIFCRTLFYGPISHY